MGKIKTLAAPDLLVGRPPDLCKGFAGDAGVNKYASRGVAVNQCNRICANSQRRS